MPDGVKSILWLLCHDKLHGDNFCGIWLNYVSKCFIDYCWWNSNNWLNVSNVFSWSAWPENDDGNLGIWNISGSHNTWCLHSVKISGSQYRIVQLGSFNILFVRHFHFKLGTVDTTVHDCKRNFSPKGKKSWLMIYDSEKVYSFLSLIR